jgi:hypothetical protein
MKLKGDPILNAVTLIVAGTAGTICGMTVEGLDTLVTLGVATAVGVVTGGVLYAVITVLKRRRAS